MSDLVRQNPMLALNLAWFCVCCASHITEFEDNRSMKTRIFAILLILTTSLFALPSFAQDQDVKPTNYQGSWWMNVGLGLGHWKTSATDSNRDSGLAGGLSINYMPSQHTLVTLRGTTIADFGFVFIPFVYWASGSDQVSDVSALFGLIQKGRWGYVSASAGLGYVHAKYKSRTSIFNPFTGQEVTSRTKHRTGTIGIPGEIQVFFTPFKFAGIGLIGFGNYNNKHSFGGVMLALQFGKLR